MKFSVFLRSYPLFAAISSRRSPQIWPNSINFVQQRIEHTKPATDGNQIDNISKFYEGSHIFITGGTGFLGKVLLEKLLRSCNSIEHVYLLIRKKKNLNVEERLKLLFESPVFQKLRENNSKCLEKVKVLHGDVALPNLGLSEAHRRLIIDKVNIVYHSAATVSFMGDLRNTLQLNTHGTKRVAELCTKIKNLKSVIHVSTIYSVLDQLEMKEIVYDPLFDPMSMVNCTNTLSPDMLKLIEKQLIGKLPNNYAFSKNLAESVFCEYCKNLPAAIVRPAIVNSAWKEPFPGWIEISGAGTNLITACTLGIVKSMRVNKDIPAHVIPVDIVANTLIAAAWYTATYRSNTLEVYNCTSEQMNELQLGRALNLVQKYSKEYPSNRVVFYPGFVYTTNAVNQGITNVLFHYIPAYIIDAYLYCANRKPRMVKTCKAIVKGLKELEFGTTLQPHIHTKNFERLMQAVHKAQDGGNFSIDMRQERGLNWDKYLKMYIIGIRQYILKNEISNIEEARAKLNRIYWTTRAIQVLSLAAFVGLIIW